MTRPALRAALRAVFDTNVLVTYVLTVSYLFTHRPPIATLIDVHLMREEIVPVTAPELLEELDRVLRYPKLQRYYAEEKRTRFVALLMALSEMVELPETIPQIGRDPDDDLGMSFIPVVACAVVGDADVIMSGDDDLLALGQVGEIPILTPSNLLERLKHQAV